MKFRRRREASRSSTGCWRSSRYDAVVQRAFIRSMNLLASPNALFEDADLVRRIDELSRRYPDAGHSNHEPPSRADLITLLTSDRDRAEEAQLG